jgi:hypothetical protein
MMGFIFHTQFRAWYAPGLPIRVTGLRHRLHKNPNSVTCFQTERNTPVLSQNTHKKGWKMYVYGRFREAKAGEGARAARTKGTTTRDDLLRDRVFFPET